MKLYNPVQVLLRNHIYEGGFFLFVSMFITAAVLTITYISVLCYAFGAAGFVLGFTIPAVIRVLYAIFKGK